MERVIKSSALQIVGGAAVGLGLDSVFPRAEGPIVSSPQAIKTGIEAALQIGANVVAGGVVSGGANIAFGITPVENAPFLLTLFGFQPNLVLKMKHLSNYARSLYSNFSLVLEEDMDDVDVGIKSVERDPPATKASMTRLNSNLLDEQYS